MVILPVLLLDLDYISNLDGGNCGNLDVLRYATLVKNKPSPLRHICFEVIESGSDARL